MKEERVGEKSGMPEWFMELKGAGRLSWMDHISHDSDGTFYSEPYGLSYNDIESLYEFCEEHSLECSIRAEPKWNPLDSGGIPSTILVQVKRKS